MGISMCYGDVRRYTKSMEKELLKPNKVEELEYVLNSCYPVLRGGKYGSLCAEHDGAFENIKYNFGGQS